MTRKRDHHRDAPLWAAVAASFFDEIVAALPSVQGFRTQISSLQTDLEGVSITMADLNQALADLTSAVSGVTDRLAAENSRQQQLLADAQATIEELRATDAADEAEIARLNSQLADQLAAAAAAADTIETHVSSLNSIAAPAAGGGDVPADGGDVPADGGDVPADGGDVPADGGDVPVDGGDVPVEDPNA
jgi:septal ring factor EnvC (AmiA/AmiB activator)